MIRRALLGAAAALLLTVPASAAPAATWTVDKAASVLGFKASASGVAFNGRFQRWDSAIAFDPKNLAASSVTTTIDVASVTTGDKDRDELLPTAEWFAVAKYPKATFVSRSFVDKGGGNYEAQGDLTIKGVKRPVVLPFKLAITGNVAKMTGSLVLDRTAFGVGTGQWKSDDTVSTKVTVLVNLTARKAG
ncbi:YceI family protein [Caulobacter sp. 17J80-11]|uniref:YceI family protein n=1 Tax=Caulobacter sp. 17J80-11 TaxID=2763502 RepID=UPI001CA4312A|nr:YceI family protein [Caulobacter sp. 17J80-11]